jgi:nucleoside-diphosphate-sugar epimerase
MILVTGGTGLLGSHLIHTLALAGHKVRASYRDKKRIQKVQALFAFYKTSSEIFSSIDWVECDVLDVVTLEEVMTGCDEVYHCAAMVSFQKKDYQTMLRINKYGTANVVNVALSLGVKRFVHVSSTAAVGKTPLDQTGYRTVVETNKWIADDNHSGYAISKYLSENEVWRGIEEGLNAVIINPSVIIGPGDWNESSLSIFRTLANGLKFYTLGANAFVDVRDVVFAMTHLIERPEAFKQRYLCTGTNVTFKQLFDVIAKQMNKKVPFLVAKSFLSGLAWRVSWLLCLVTGNQTVTKESASSAQAKVTYDSSKLKKVLDFEFRSLEETVKHAVEGRLM